jgi:hypothetical protein
MPEETIKATDTMTVVEGFDAMRAFLEAVWLRQGKDAAEVAYVLGGSRWPDGTPADPTIWEEWLLAVRACRSASSGSMRDSAKAEHGPST